MFHSFLCFYFHLLLFQKEIVENSFLAIIIGNMVLYEYYYLSSELENLLSLRISLFILKLLSEFSYCVNFIKYLVNQSSQVNLSLKCFQVGNNIQKSTSLFNESFMLLVNNAAREIQRLHTENSTVNYFLNILYTLNNMKFMIKDKLSN